MEQKSFENSDVAKCLANYKLPRFNELAKYDLIMNQLVEVLNDYLSVFLIPGEGKMITSSMINNYVNKHVIESPKQKKYSRVHLVHLLAIGIMKQVLSLTDAAKLLEMQMKQYPVDVAYDYFCMELENALKVTFGLRNFSNIENFQPTKTTALTQKTRSAVLAFANQVYVKQSIYYDNLTSKI